MPRALSRHHSVWANPIPDVENINAGGRLPSSHMLPFDADKVGCLDGMPTHLLPFDVDAAESGSNHVWEMNVWEKNTQPSVQKKNC